MSEWWKTVKKILSGKPKGSKLMVLGVFLVSIGTTLEITFGQLVGTIFFIVMGMWAFMWGWSLYRDEAEYELEKRRKEDAQKREQNKL